MDWDAKTAWTFVLVIVAALAYRYLPRWQARSPFVGPDVLKQRLDSGDDVVVIDVRTEGEFHGRLGHIPGAVNAPLSDLKARLGTHDAELQACSNHPVFVYCLGEGRGARAARSLRDTGFTDVSVLKGGLRAWLRRTYPTEKPS